MWCCFPPRQPGPCLVVITERRFIGKIYDHDIWEVAATEVLPFARNNRHLATVQVENEKAYLELLQSALSGNRLYFSYRYAPLPWGRVSRARARSATAGGYPRTSNHSGIFDLSVPSYPVHGSAMT